MRVPRKPLIISGPCSNGETAGKGAVWSRPRRSSPACKPANRPAAAHISSAPNTNVDIVEDASGDIQHVEGNFHDWLPGDRLEAGGRVSKKVNCPLYHIYGPFGFPYQSGFKLLYIIGGLQSFFDFLLEIAAHGTTRSGCRIFNNGCLSIPKDIIYQAQIYNINAQ